MPTDRRARRDIAAPTLGVGLRAPANDGAGRGRAPSPAKIWLVAAATPAPAKVDRPSIEEGLSPDQPWQVVVWNDPINLMSYVTWVFQTLFGYSKPKAEKLMLDVHHKGRAVVSSGPRERAESDVFRLHAYGLWATMEKPS